MAHPASASSPNGIVSRYRDHLGPQLKPICDLCQRVLRDMGTLKRHMTEHFPDEKAKLKKEAVGRIIDYQVSCVLKRTDDEGKQYFDRDYDSEMRVLLHQK